MSRSGAEQVAAEGTGSKDEVGDDDQKDDHPPSDSPNSPPTDPPNTPPDNHDDEDEEMEDEQHDKPKDERKDARGNDQNEANVTEDDTHMHGTNETNGINGLNGSLTGDNLGLRGPVIAYPRASTSPARCYFEGSYHDGNQRSIYMPQWERSGFDLVLNDSDAYDTRRYKTLESTETPATSIQRAFLHFH